MLKISSLIRKIVLWTGSPPAVVLAGIFCIMYPVVGEIRGFSGSYTDNFNITISLISFFLLFSVQFTACENERLQRVRDEESEVREKALHVKLDSLISALDSADSRYIGLEKKTAEEVEKAEKEMESKCPGDIC